MSGAFGVNVLSHYVRDRAALMNWLTAAQPAAVVCMDDHNLTQQIRAALPNSVVIHRAYNPNDARWWLATTPHDWLAAHVGFAANGVVLQCLNEPLLDDAALTWLEQLCAICPPHVRLAFPNFSVGNPHEDDILAGKYDRLLKLVCGTRHVLALHEYFRNNPLEEANYLCGRFRYWLARADALGLPAPRIIITEHGRDHGGGRNDGWRGMGWTDEGYFARLQSAQALYGSANIPVCIYGWGTGANNDWLSFDIQDAPALQQRLIDWNKTHPMREDTPVTQPNWQSHDWGQRIDGETARTTALINIRQFPDTSSADRGDLADGTTITYWDKPYQSGTLRWYKVLHEGVERYVAEVADLRFERQPSPDPAEPMMTISVARYNALYAAAKGMVQALEEVTLPDTGSPF